eukprot:1151996-Pelagomonas_calceolata.AAC.11
MGGTANALLTCKLRFRCCSCCSWPSSSGGSNGCASSRCCPNLPSSLCSFACSLCLVLELKRTKARSLFLAAAAVAAASAAVPSASLVLPLLCPPPAAAPASPLASRTGLRGQENAPSPVGPPAPSPLSASAPTIPPAAAAMESSASKSVPMLVRRLVLKDTLLPASSSASSPSSSPSMPVLGTNDASEKRLGLDSMARDEDVCTSLCEAGSDRRFERMVAARIRALASNALLLLPSSLCRNLLQCGRLCKCVGKVHVAG